MALSVVHTKTLIAPDSGSEDKVYGVDYVAADSHDVTGTLPASDVTGLAAIATSGDVADLGGLGSGVETALGTAVNTTGGFPTVGATLTSGRVAIVGTGGVIEDDAGMTYDKTTDKLTLAGGVQSPEWRTGTASTDIQLTKVTNGFSEPTATFLQGNATAGACIHANFLTLGTAVNSASGTTTWINGNAGGYVAVANGNGFAFSPNTGSLGNINTVDSTMWRGGATNSILYNGTTSPSTATSRTEINKAVTAFTDGVAKATFTVTIPNASHNATLEVEVTGVCGAGGAIGAGEASATNSYKINISRTAGVNAVVGISAAYGAAASNVAGGTTITATAAASAVAGAVGATNTFTVDVTITKGGGASDNHTCLIYGKLMNKAASGITIA